MTPRKQRLELTWIGKEERPRLEPRILLEDLELSYHAEKRVTDHDIFDNRLIHGDNLLALKALEQKRSTKRRQLFEAQDDVDRKRAELIEEIERQLQTKTSIEPVFTLRWTLAEGPTMVNSPQLEER